MQALWLSYQVLNALDCVGKRFGKMVGQDTAYDGVTLGREGCLDPCVLRLCRVHWCADST